MTALQLADRIGNIDEDLIPQTFDSLHPQTGNGTVRISLKLRRTLLLAAAIIAILALCGFFAVQLGFCDPWLQKPSTDPIETVQSAIENQMEKDYAITVRIDEITIDTAETERMIERYSGSELADSRGWSNEYLSEHFLAIRAKYYVEYDHTKTFLDDGTIDQYFYLAEDMESGNWTIIDNSTPGEPAARQ